MKIYFAGPLFTPYVRQFISEQACILRENGIEVFVPHEQSFNQIVPGKVDELLVQGLISAADLQGKPEAEAVMDLVRVGRLSREQVGLPPIGPETVFDVDYAGLSTANAVVALLDGTQVDDGTACEIGIFHALVREDPVRKKGIIGYITDQRGVRKKEAGYGQNFFVLGILEEYSPICADLGEVIARLKAWDAELPA